MTKTRSAKSSIDTEKTTGATVAHGNSQGITKKRSKRPNEDMNSDANEGPVPKKKASKQSTKKPVEKPKLKAKPKTRGSESRKTSVSVPSKTVRSKAAKSKTEESHTILEHSAAAIDVDESSSEEEPTEALDFSSNKLDASKQIAAKEDNEEEIDVTADTDIEMEPEDCLQDKDAGVFVQAPQFMSRGGGNNKNRQRVESVVLEDSDHNRDYVIHRSRRASRHTSRTSSIEVDIPPTSDTEGLLSSLGDITQPSSDTEKSELDGSDEASGLEDAVQTKAISGKTAKKLRDELPLVSNKGLPTSKAAANKVKTTEAPKPAEFEASDDDEWGLRTNIILEPHKDSTRSFKLALKGQNSDIRAVVDRARILGVVKLVSDPKECPVSKNLKAIALASLIDAAENLGYDGQGDIADRLERGDILKYIKPLVKYTASRISLERKMLKLPVSTVLTALGLDNSPEGIATAAELVRNGDYIYPKNSAGDYDYQSPFTNTVIHKYISDMFFGNNKLARVFDPFRKDLFVSSRSDHATAKLELEVPKAMVATVACAIHAILLDHSLSTAMKFPPVGLHRQWSGYIDLLKEMEAKNKNRAHKTLHDIYLKASHSIAPATHGLSGAQIISRVNWDVFAEPVEDDEHGEAA
ncbi:hypothetical protein K435DRAFT_802403 [Dendrothele bispora CBS 962.96]|uniref:DUF6532 domain-containing protein n=1 Tax=Dendrothele bispora (strain CBS 962.96) TaxID=1314807 RepID=A0A4S8LKW1_DENBC|nr:hypothetical protein K435DRAFT_802403 [Dendrothele bispora CBS 962.96]